MKLNPYRKILEMGKDAARAVMVPVRVARARAQADLELAKLDERLATLEARLNEATSEEQLDFDKIIDLLDDAALVEMRTQKLKEVVQQLFPSV